MRSFEWTLATFFVGAVVLIAAYAIGILNVDVCWGGSDIPSSQVLVPCSGAYAFKKQVGFGWALNWSVGLCVLLPFFVYCASETIRHGAAAIAEMVQRKMLVRDDWSTPKAEVIMALVRKRQRIIAISVAGVVAILATVFIVTDFTRVVGQYYGTPDLLSGARIADPDFEADWSIAAPVCRFTADTSSACASLAGTFQMNGIFAGVVYLYLPFAGAVAAITFMVAFGLFVRFVFAADLRAAGIRVVPDINSKDPRRGFEVLEEFFLYSVIACFVLFAMGYLVTLQNVYLRTDSPNVFAFVLPLVPTEISLDLGKLLTAMQQSLSLIVVNGNSVAVTILGILFLGIVLLSAAAVLGREAKAGRDRLLQALESNVASEKFAKFLGGTSPAAAKKALKEAEFWPLKWPSVNSVIVWLVLATISLLFVVVGFYVVAFGLAYVAKQAFQSKS
ncbi:MAG: hypothetical protein KKF33_07010 [Alphaproteobacteria bacterium]|nr:hypothetical protein [Alphaproteobacteria bacterium]